VWESEGEGNEKKISCHCQSVRQTDRLRGQTDTERRRDGESQINTDRQKHTFELPQQSGERP
jgi:hypothetical protein